ncbi:hypothetical protein JMJ35_001805 [Cladonia borealis]|uniref:Gcp-like domain-containing protein n=1 Tax=Cladonia borealis TaxID=184061 RepID=A0AA39UDR1_9LECA|nr:hypothetical protein JMJ35_001805 [Cladonia borealis]
MLACATKHLRRNGTAHAQALHLVQSRRRQLLTLAIETSCDDTSVAVLEKRDNVSPLGHTYTFPSTCALHFHEKITANNSDYGGVHPIKSLESHQENLALLINRAISALPNAPNSNGDNPSDPSRTLTLYPPYQTPIHKLKPDFISVTRGPGMRSSLATGLDTAKGLSTAWQIPLLAVNHMQAHALTPRLVSALTSPPPLNPPFPFLTLLISGGHTLLLHSKSLTSHPLLATTTDIALGDCIDKIARHLLPPPLLSTTKGTMYGPLLERFAFPTSPPEYNYTAPTTRAQEIARITSERWGWSLVPPLAETRSGSKSRSMEFTFSGLESAVKRICEWKGKEMGEEERRELARESMRLAFEHLASRVGWALNNLEEKAEGVKTLVVSGGVASNGFLRHILHAFLTARGYPHLNLIFPPVDLCTDNAAMIAWTGMEMWEAGWESELSIRGLRKWSLDSENESGSGEGGILGVGGWKKRS